MFKKSLWNVIEYREDMYKISKLATTKIKF